MKTFATMEEAIQELTSENSPMYYEFSLSAEETTRYCDTMLKLTALAEEQGIKDKRHDGLALTGMLGGAAGVFLGVASLNPFVIAGGVGAAMKGFALSKAADNHGERVEQAVTRIANLDPALKSDVDLLARFRGAITSNCVRHFGSSALQMSKNIPSSKYITAVWDSRDGSFTVSVDADDDHFGFTEANRPKELVCRLAPPSTYEPYPYSGN